MRSQSVVHDRKPKQQSPVASYVSRSFQDRWKDGGPWLKTNEDKTEMFCEWCVEYLPNCKSSFVTGVTTMKKETLVLHSKSKAHMIAEVAHENALKRAKSLSSIDVSGTIEKGLQQIPMVSGKEMATVDPRISDPSHIRPLE